MHNKGLGTTNLHLDIKLVASYIPHSWHNKGFVNIQCGSIIKVINEAQWRQCAGGMIFGLLFLYTTNKIYYTRLSIPLCVMILSDCCGTIVLP